MRFHYFALGFVLSVGCSGGVFIPRSDGGNSFPDASQHSDGGTAHGDLHRYVFDRLTLPTQKTDYAIDLNGDGTADNQLGNILASLASQGTSPQPAQDMQIATGGTVYLVAMQTADATLMNDSPVAVTLYNGQPTAPDFSGNGSFATDGNPPAQLTGALAGGQFSSENPVTTKSPATYSMALALFAGVSGTPLLLHGVHVKFHTGIDGGSGAPGLIQGELHGSIKHSDVETMLFPQVAALFTQRIAADPNSAGTMQIEQIFDTGGCTDPNGTPAFANDGVIATCEVSQNQIIQSTFAPDVQIYDGNGNYAPNPANAAKDSISVGISFSAVRATF